jgi:hypothetical protein
MYLQTNKLGLSANLPVRKIIMAFALAISTLFALPELNLPFNALNSVAFADASAPDAGPLAGHDKVSVRVFVDRGCAAPYQHGIDVPLHNARVQLTFSDGSSVIRETTSSGMVYFAGIDASGGVSVSLLGLADMRYRGQYLCACNPTTTYFSAGDFNTANVGHKHYDFRVTPSLSPWPY